eukprot:3254885-Amphidinium_carterae.1
MEGLRRGVSDAQGRIFGRTHCLLVPKSASWKNSPAARARVLLACRFRWGCSGVSDILRPNLLVGHRL